MTKNELIATPDDLRSLMESTAPSPYATETAMSMVTKVGNYLPYISVFGSNSMEVKRGQFSMGHFGLRRSKKVIVDLGTEFVAFVLDWRAKAMQYLPETLSFFDTESAAFKEIQATADQKDSNRGYGPEFLIWLPDQHEFATYFLGNPTGRNEAPNLLGPLKERGPFVCLQKAVLIENRKGQSWHGPSTASYDLEFDYPPMDQLKAELEKFRNPGAAVKEPTEKDEDTRR